MTSYRGFLAALLGAGTLILSSPTAHASPPTETKTIKVRAEYTEPMSSFDGIQCRGLGAPPPDCEYVFVGPTTFTGSIAGEAYYETTGPTSGGHSYEGWDRFEDAVVEGCGRGGFVIDVFDGEIGQDPQLDPVRTTGFNTWRVRAGSGRGGLAGLMSGEGENHWEQHWTDTGETWGRGVFTGTITCEVPRTPAQGPKTEIRTFPVRAEYTDPMPGAGARCRGVAAGEPSCQALFPGPVRFTGTISGMARHETAGPAADGSHYEGPDIFDDAVVEGCGRGGLILDTFGGMMHPEDVREDLSTGGFNKWRLRPGSGTGGLSGLISGEGENHWRQYWSDSGTETWGRGLYTGTITCAVPVNDARTAAPGVAGKDKKEKEKAPPAAAIDGGRESTSPESGSAIVLASVAQREGVLPQTGMAAMAGAAGAVLLAASLAGRRLVRPPTR